jgi:hypothetical protein
LALVTAIQRICSLRFVLDFKETSFRKWRSFLTIAITTYALEDHLTTNILPYDHTWLCLDT